MKMFVWSWRQSLAAAALAAVLSPAASDAVVAVAAEGQPEAPVAKAEREGERGEVKREREAERPEAGEGREGERPAARREGEREGERPAARREGEREGERPAARREGEREGERPAVRREGEREGERPAVRREGEGRPAPSPERMEERRRLEEKATDLRRKLDSLRPDQDAEARELRAALGRIEVELRGGPPPRDAGDRAPLMARLEEIKAAIQRAREAGNRDQVELLERKAHEVLEQLGQRQGDRPRPEGEAEESQRRMQHLRVAIENLRAAGLNAQADVLAGEAERWMRERGMPPGRPPEGRERPDMPPMVHFERAIHEIHQQLDELRRQLEEMRRHMHELSEQVRR